MLVPAGHALAKGKRLKLTHVEVKSYQVIIESSNAELSALYASLGLGLAVATLVDGISPSKAKGLHLIPLSYRLANY